MLKTLYVSLVSLTGTASAQKTILTRPSRDSIEPTGRNEILQLILERSEDPTSDNPLTYRERCFLIPASFGLPEIESALREQLDIIERELSSTPPGKLVNLVAFDHFWQDRPERPPVMALRSKDWRDEIKLEFFTPEKEPENPDALFSYEEDRLTKVFESIYDLHFLENAAEGMAFTIQLLHEVIIFDAASGYLYDINSHQLRLVAASGPGAEEHKGRGIPLDRGLLGYAARQRETSIIYSALEKNPNFDAEIDARGALNAKSLLLTPLVQDNQLFGVIQLINGKEIAGFTTKDAGLVNYVGKQLTDFIRRTRGGRSPNGS